MVATLLAVLFLIPLASHPEPSDLEVNTRGKRTHAT
jgi:hypothetical protein